MNTRRERLKTARPTAQLRAGRNDWYRITNLADGAAEVAIYDEVGLFGVTASDFIAELQTINARSISLYLSSPGGEVFDGIAIYNALRSHRARVTVQVQGLAASIASVIAMAGDRIVMAPHSQLMIHDALTVAVGNAAELRDMADQLDRQSDNIAGIYAERAGGTVKQWRKAMEAETWYSAAEAVAAGLADEVAKPQRQDEEQPAMAARWDLSIFRYAGRDAAPAPVMVASAAGAPDAPRVEDTASGVHHTATEDSAWDGPAAVANMPNDAATLRAAHAWHDPDGDPDAKSSYKFPHHHTKGGPANLAACRNGLARLSSADIPESDRAGVEAHLRAHLKDGGGDDAEDRASAATSLTGWDPAVFRAGVERAAGVLTDWDPGLFRSAIASVSADAPAPAARQPEPEPAVEPEPEPVAEPEPSHGDMLADTVRTLAADAPAPPVMARPPEPEPQPEPPPAPEPAPEPQPQPLSLGEIFRAAVQLQANDRPAPTSRAPDPEPEPDPYDPTVFTRALKEASR